MDSDIPEPPVLEFTPLQEAFRNDGSPEALVEKYLHQGPKRGRKPMNGERKVGAQTFVLNADDAAIIQANGEAGLANQKLPDLRIETETVEHRFLVYLFASNMSLKDVFLECGGEWDHNTGTPIPNTGKWSYSHLSQIRRQPWFTAAVLRVMEDAGKDRVQAALDGQVIRSIETLVTIRDTAEKDSDRLRAADSLLDRAIGKATSHVKIETTRTVADHEDELAEIKRQINALNEEGRALGVALD